SRAKWIKQAVYEVQQQNQVKKTEFRILSPTWTCSSLTARAIHGYAESFT
ncbi:mCG144988, partial [Mus musculus]